MEKNGTRALNTIIAFLTALVMRMTMASLTPRQEWEIGASVTTAAWEIGASVTTAAWEIGASVTTAAWEIGASGTTTLLTSLPRFVTTQPCTTGLQLPGSTTVTTIMTDVATILAAMNS